MSDGYTYKTYGVTLSNISEGFYSIEEIEKLLVDMKATKKQTEERLNMIMQAAIPDDDDDTQVYKKPWVGLTVTTILNMMPSTIPADFDGELMEFARAVEDKLKEKNNG